MTPCTSTRCAPRTTSSSATCCTTSRSATRVTTCIVHLSSEGGRLTPERIAELVPDWTEREAFLSGPGDMLDALKEHWHEHGAEQRMSMERFQPRIGGDEVEPGAGGTIYFRVTDVKAECDGRTPDPRRRRGGRRDSCRSAAGWASATPASGDWRREPFAICAPVS